jgi:hypothetical protein
VRAARAKDLRREFMWWKALTSSHMIVTNACRRGVSSVIGSPPPKNTPFQGQKPT